MVDQPKEIGNGVESGILGLACGHLSAIFLCPKIPNQAEPGQVRGGESSFCGGFGHPPRLRVSQDPWDTTRPSPESP